MKPLKLTIKGLNSFIQAQTIDFEQLSSKGIFGIFGPTGSGKSTILDGITLALYGDLARKSNGFVNSSEEVRQANVSLTFQISGQTVRIFQVDRIFTKNKDSWKKPVSKSVLKEIKDGDITVLEEGTALVNEACERLIGLKKEDFLRTVVLPQGKFSEFLMLTGKERNEMLERLFNLEQYGEQLSARIGEEKRILSHAMENLKGRLSGYEEISEEILKQRKKEHRKWELEQKDLLEAAGRLEQTFEEKQKLKRLLEEKVGYEKRQNLLFLQEQEAACWENQTVLAEEIRTVKPVKERYDQKEQELFNAEETLAAGKQAEEFAETEKVKAEQVLKQAKSREERLPALLDKKKNLELAVPKNQEMMRLKEEQEKRICSLSLLEETLRQLKQEEKRILEQKNQVRERQQDQARLLEQNQISPILRKQVQDGVLLERELQKEEKEQGDIKTVRDRLLWETEELEKEWRKQVRRETEISKELLRWEENDRERMLRVFRNTLKEGDPCPVCGAVHHDLNQFFQSDFEEEMEKANSSYEREALEKEQERLQKVTSELNLRLSAQKAKLEGAEERLAEISGRIAKRKSRLEKEKKVTTCLSFEKKQEEFIQMDRQSELLRKRLGEMEKAGLALQEQWDMTTRKRTDLELQKARMETSQAETETTLLSLQMEIAALVGEGTGSREELKETIDEIERIQNFVRKAGETFEEKRQKAVKAREQAAVSQTRRNDVQTAWEEAKSQLCQVLSTCPGLNRQMEKSRESVGETIEKWEIGEEEETKLKEKIRRYREEIISISSQIAEKESLIQGRTLSETEWQELGKEKKQMEMCLEEKRTEGIRLWDSLIQGEIRLKEKKKLEEDYQKKEHRQALVAQLEKLIKGKRFVEYAAREKLQYVSREASVLLNQLSCGNYELECDEQGHFQIIDFKNGGVRRFASTLSGGEVFLASLSLALALSSQIQLSSHTSLELFFLDEGFGTLDDNLLEVVMDALENLQSLSSRAIGLITHVEKLQNQMPVKLLVKPAESGGKGSRTEIEIV